MIKLPKHLQEALKDVCNNGGEDIKFALGHLRDNTASSYVSKLKKLGLAYTCRWNGITEVWATDDGYALRRTFDDCGENWER